MNNHPTQIFLHNAFALRIEFRLDDSCLELWWSPLAGKSFLARDRNFSNRDNHLRVFERIEIPECGLENFVSCDYDPYHCVLVFRDRTLHLSPHTGRAAVLIWSDQPLVVDFKTARYDEWASRSDVRAEVRHQEPGGEFLFGARMGEGSGCFRFSPVHSEWNSHYFQACPAAGQGLEISVRLADDEPETSGPTRPGEWLDAVESVLAEDLRHGRIVAPGEPLMERTRRTVVRGLHSMIDESGAFRASLKAIYYLIWVRDAAFAFNYQASAGWPQKLGELCRLLLANPTTARGDGVPSGRMFAQLINPDYGKYEEDGIFYVVLTLFNHWTLTGEKTFLEGPDRELVGEALDWVERSAYDSERQLFGGRFADETPARGSRDYGWDFAIGKPSGDEHIWVNGKAVVRSFDIYLNTLMHSVYVMLAASSGEEEGRCLLDKARRLEPGLDGLLLARAGGLPLYGELVCSDGSVERVPAWGPVSSVYVWALTLPHHLDYPGREEVLSTLFDRLLENPRMHWINGLCAAAAALDPWWHGESRQIDLLRRIAEETARPGKYLPMGGAMPEKFGATDGDFYHDIRPQGFAMGTWLGAWAGLGVRRLAQGLAVRPTAAFEAVLDFEWRGMSIDFHFWASGRNLALEINGSVVRGTLQIPEEALWAGRNVVHLREDTECPHALWLRSSVRLLAAGISEWTFEAFGLSEIVLECETAALRIEAADGRPVDFKVRREMGVCFLRFVLWGQGTLTLNVG